VRDNRNPRFRRLRVCAARGAGRVGPYMSARPVAESILLRITQGRNRLSRRQRIWAILRSMQRKMGFSAAVTQRMKPHMRAISAC